jgi:glutamine synthetase
MSNTKLEFDLFVADLNGNLRGKRMPPAAVKKMHIEGMKLPLSVMGFDFWGADVLDNGLVFETGDADGVCRPVAQELTPVPWARQPRNQMLATMFQEDGSPFEGDPRQVLNKVYQRFRAMGLRPVMATELEFYVLDGESSSSLRPLPPRLGGDQGPRLSGDEGYSVVEMDGFADFLAELRSACDTQGIPADTVISEMGPGQFEINLNHIDNPLIAADHAILFKRLVKGVAQKHGLAATFMAKPYADCSGNGFHCHFSLVDDEGNNVFDDGTDAGSDMLKYAIAGLMQTMGDSMLCFAPHMNSYRRFMEGSHAPTFATWGYENRTVAIRVPDSPGVARRLEHRVSGADANPYLVLAAILAGALYGIEHKLVPPPAMEGDAYSNADEEQRLPNSWSLAIEALSQSDILNQYLGETFVRVFTAAKRQELRKLSAKITDVEYDAYLAQL